MPLVSIIVASYQAEEWIDETLRSICDQTYKNLDIIVVDDGSTDGTVRRIRERAMRDGRIRLAALPANQGASAARNHGLALAQGDFVKFCDADDIVSCEMIEKQLAVLRDHPESIAYSEWARFGRDPAEAVFRPRRGWHDGAPVDWIVETWQGAEPMYQCGQFLLPRSLLRRCGGWDPTLSLMDDFEFFTRVVLSSGGVRFSSGARLHYRSGISGSISRLTSSVAILSGWRSTYAAVQRLMAAETSDRTRKVSADILMNFVFAYYPAEPSMMGAALAEVAALGGSTHMPSGGLGFRLACHVIGWRTALRLRRWRARLYCPPKVNSNIRHLGIE